MALAVYAATALLVLGLVHRFVQPLTRGAAIFLFLVPFALAGEALLTNKAFGPIDAAYIGEPLSAIRLLRGIGAPHNFVTTDIYTQMIPWRHVVRESLRHGEWPLWNPYILCGDILAAAAQPAAYHPFTLIACLLPAPLSFTFSVAILFLVAAIGAFTLARELGCRDASAAVAAVGWTYCSSLALYVLWPHGCWAYLPLVLLATRRVVHEPGLRSGAFLLTSLTLLILAGHPETVLHIVTLGVAYALFEMSMHHRMDRRRPGGWNGGVPPPSASGETPLAQPARTPAVHRDARPPVIPSVSEGPGRSGGMKRLPRALLVASIAGVLALMLSAIYLLPFLEAVPQTAEYPWRQTLSRIDHFETPLEVGVSVLTNFFPFLHIRRWIEPGPAGLKAETAAVGSVILALALYGIWRVRSRNTWFFTGFAVVCLLIHSAWKPVAELLRHVPLYDLSINVRFAFGAALAFALLAAFGVEELLRRDDRRAAAITMSVVLVLLTIGQLWIKHSFVIADYGNWGSYREFAELFFLGVATLALVPRLPLRAIAPALVLFVVGQRMVSEGGVHKSFPMNVAYPKMQVLAPMNDVREPFRAVGQGVALIPGMNAFYGLEDPRGYEAMTFDPLFKTYPLWSVHQAFFFNRIDDITKPFVSMMNVRFAIAGVWLPVPPGWRLVAQQRHVILLENMNAFDRAFIPHNVQLGLSDDATLEAMKTADFHDRAWITSDAAIDRANGPGTVTNIRRTGMSRFDLDADMQGDGWIVLTESAWKGWRAYVDGRRVKTQRANVAFLSVYVPKGRHAIRFVYWPQSFVVGRAISLATLLGIVTLALLGRRRSRLRFRS
jgi:membrane protein YfhO